MVRCIYNFFQPGLVLLWARTQADIEHAPNVHLDLRGTVLVACVYLSVRKFMEKQLSSWNLQHMQMWNGSRFATLNVWQNCPATTMLRNSIMAAYYSGRLGCQTRLNHQISYGLLEPLGFSNHRLHRGCALGRTYSMSSALGGLLLCSHIR